MYVHNDGRIIHPVGYARAVMKRDWKEIVNATG